MHALLNVQCTCPTAGAKLYFPNIALTLVRSNLPPNQAVFRVPAQLNKVDLSSLLSSMYGIQVLDVRTMNYLGRTNLQGAGRRVKSANYKKAIVTMGEDFVWPELPKLDRKEEAVKMPPRASTFGKGVPSSYRTQLQQYLDKGY
jgi:ribosomal protein L23